MVSVKVPAHQEVVDAALDAGKHVLCEWPLGRCSDQAAAMTQRAEQAGVRGFIGLQARANLAVDWAREQIAAGLVGTPIALSARSSRASRGRPSTRPTRTPWT